MVAGELLDPTKHTDLTASTLIHAMKMAGHPPAQDALAALALDPRLAQQNRLRATIDLGGVEAPTSETQQRLWQLSEGAFDARSTELATTATLALGRIGRTMRVAGDPEYALLRDRLQGSLLAAHDDDGRAALLTAAGNTADPELRPAVASAMNASSPRLRTAAAKALGRIPDSQPVLLQGLAQDPSPRVRGQIAKGLLAQGQLGTAPLRIVARKIRSETDEGARYAMARLLGENDPGDGGSIEALRDLMRTESSKRIRQYVAGRLAQER
jgi:HEAT repeat protein